MLDQAMRRLRPVRARTSAEGEADPAGAVDGCAAKGCAFVNSIKLHTGEASRGQVDAGAGEDFL